MSLLYNGGVFPKVIQDVSSCLFFFAHPLHDLPFLLHTHTHHLSHCLALVSLSLTFSFCLGRCEGSEIAQRVHPHIIPRR